MIHDAGSVEFMTLVKAIAFYCLIMAVLLNATTCAS